MSQTRKLAAILSADVVGYSRLMGENDRETVQTLQNYRTAIQELVAAHQGRVVNTPGDALLAEFPSAIEAVQCASEIQDEIQPRNIALPEERRMRFRIGVNLGDVIQEADGTLYGDGVNIAARLEALAEPDGVCISGKVFEEIEGRSNLAFEYAGEQAVKHITKPIRVYRLRRGGPEAPGNRPRPRSWSTPRLFTAVVLMALAAVGIAWWQLHQPAALSEGRAPAVPARPSVAVLPFANMSGSADQDFFADGITEQVITELARFRDLSVIARNSTFSYKGKAVDVRQAGKDLGARYVVEGSVQRSGTRVRVTVQLLDARDGAHLWAETYERDLKRTKTFGVQDEITERVVTAIGDNYGAISRATFEEAKSKGTDNLDAYECVLHYYAYGRTMAPKEHARVRTCLERSVELAPSYAEAWAGLADVYSDEYVEDYNPKPESLDRALRAARRAVELDPASPRAYMMLGKVHFFMHDMDGFVPAAQRAVALNPNNADILAWYGVLWTYGHWGDPATQDRGVQAMRRAIAISPIYPSWYHLPIAWTYYASGNYSAALAEAKKVDMPDYYWTHQLLAAIYSAMGRQADARAHVARLLELYPTFPHEVRQIWEKWNVPDFVVDKVIGDLQRAGMDIPEHNSARHGAKTPNITLNRNVNGIISLAVAFPSLVSVGVG